MHGLPKRTKTVLLTLVWATLLGLAGAASALQPALTLSRGDSEIALSLADLEAMPQHELVTTNEFSDGLVAYVGPLARDVLAEIDLSGVKLLRFKAINDYYIDVPVSDLLTYNVIFALEADGQRLSRRDKGPIWLMYPISDYPELSDPIYNSRLIWQVVQVEAL